ncbi:uncharacterized protein EHS24_005315 [Apiotrichum porosum]|uniref:Uncharacterized protein n=1 Tax=Apiotrichum porosum TaxID=105984 RepID=A0A427XD34_9TREE|nr:uncharacterized protein EHS24_005315 [Apiotrichum porosum]RSH76738.1 hypothetical protein EHS24_005315 [Apiotrichum porosum]
MTHHQFSRAQPFTPTLDTFKPLPNPPGDTCIPVGTELPPVPPPTHRDGRFSIPQRSATMPHLPTNQHPSRPSHVRSASTSALVGRTTAPSAWSGTRSQRPVLTVTPRRTPPPLSPEACNAPPDYWMTEVLEVRVSEEFSPWVYVPQPPLRPVVRKPPASPTNTTPTPSLPQPSVPLSPLVIQNPDDSAEATNCQQTCRPKKPIKPHHLRSKTLDKKLQHPPPSATLTRPALPPRYQPGSEKDSLSRRTLVGHGTPQMHASTPQVSLKVNTTQLGYRLHTGYDRDGDAVILCTEGQVKTGFLVRSTALSRLRYVNGTPLAHANSSSGTFAQAVVTRDAATTAGPIVAVADTSLAISLLLGSLIHGALISTHDTHRLLSVPDYLTLLAMYDKYAVKPHIRAMLVHAIDSRAFELAANLNTPASATSRQTAVTILQLAHAARSARLWEAALAHAPSWATDPWVMGETERDRWGVDLFDVLLALEVLRKGTGERLGNIRVRYSADGTPGVYCAKEPDTVFYLL